MVLISKAAALGWMSTVPVFKSSNLPKHHYTYNSVPRPDGKNFIPTNNLYPKKLIYDSETFMFDPILA